MMTDSEFDRWCQRLQLFSKARQEIELIRTSEPSRRVGGGRKSVSGRYPSRKMGFTIQFESHKVELPYIYELEHSEDVLEYYDQPPPFKINYQSESGRNLGFYITPDFFVLYRDGFEWVECKTEEKFKTLAEKSPNRYFKTENNNWRSPPAEEYPKTLGGRFRLWSSAEINWKLQRNLEFLQDYYLFDDFLLSESATALIKSLVSAQPGITLSYLIHHADGIKTDDIYHLIVQEIIYVDLANFLLVEADKCPIFANLTTASAYSALFSSQSSPNALNSPIITLTTETQISYDGKPLTIILVGDNNVLLQSEDGQNIEFSQVSFDDLVRQGKITSLPSQKKTELASEVMNIYLQASEKDLEQANKRYQQIQSYLNGQSLPINIPERTLYDWLSKYRQAEQQYGYGYVGLISLDKKKGNRCRKLPQTVLKLIEKFIEQDYETKKQKRKQAVYNDFVNYCAGAGLSDEQIPSYKTFIMEIKKRSGYEQTLKREGHRAAYEKESFYWELKQTTPRHGDFPFHICHVDHTQLDIELRCSKTSKNLGRPWLTLLMDAYSRRILAVYITFDHPSYRSCMYYDDYTMGHPFLDAAFERLKPIIREPGESRVLFIVGPTGAGKTKLIKLVHQWIIQQLLPELEIDRGRIPFALVEAKLPKSGLFNPKDHLKRSLYALHEPQKFIDSKINYGVSGVYINEENQLVVRPKLLETDLGWALEVALKYRRPQIFCIDEAHHMLSVASGRKLTDVPEAIKSLANITEILHGLVGTYELLTLQDIGDQLSRRSVYIHLPRYDIKYTEDREIWQSIVWNFQGHLPVHETPDFLGIWDYLYERSLGCVGILKNWTRNAFADTLEKNSTTITLSDLEARALSASQALNILRKIKEGEKKYADMEAEVELLRTELNLGIEPQPRPKCSAKKVLSPTQESSKTHVGKRNPTRDAIGVQQNVR